MITDYFRCSNCNNAFDKSLTECPRCNNPDWACEPFSASPRDYIYDIETYPNFFSYDAVHAVTGTRFYFEMSSFRDDKEDLYNHLLLLNKSKARMVGFNNVGFDYPVIHEFIKTVGHATSMTLYRKVQAIFNGDRFEHIVWPSDRYIEQLDLFKVNHFDNKARSVSLKVLQINMRSKSVEDLPIKPGSLITPMQAPLMREYNRHDVDETLKFYFKCADKIKFRETLSSKYNKDFTNHNDTKIGKDYFIKILEDNRPGTCYGHDRKPRQSIRPSINLDDVILPIVEFEHPEFNRVLEYLKSQVITETKGVFKDLHCTVNDFSYHFGVGGIHGSVNWQDVRSTDDEVIIDVDVASYYPNLAIANDLFPEHLGEKFCEIYLDVYKQRKTHAKGTPENAMLKLALNGVYGDSNNPYSPFYDAKYTMSITINGQLLLCMLAEKLSSIPGLKMIQINTDGLTVKIPRDFEFLLDDICHSWESLTKLELEKAHYKRMVVRDVNAYIAEYENGDFKRKGVYEYDHNELDWHKNHSSLVIPLAAFKYLFECVPIEDTVRNHGDIFDFMIKAKAPRSNYILHGDTEQQNTLRYYVSTDGKPLVKVAPPVKGAKVGQYKRKNGITDSYYYEVLSQVGDEWDERIHTKNKSTYTERRTEFEKGYLTTVCNKVEQFSFDNVNYDYYINEAKKLVNFETIC